MGELGRKFGRTHHFHLKTSAEAIRALCANFPGFEKELMSSAQRNVGYQVHVGSAPIDSVAQIHFPIGRQDIKIIPTVMGSGPVGRIILGSVLIAAAIIATPFTAGSSLAFIPGIAGSIGISFALGGISQLLAKNPKAKNAEDPSSSFSGAVNLTSQGHPVPVGYGRMIVGSVVIGAGIDTEDRPVT